MSTQIIQVRDVPTEEVDVLRARAAARNISLSRYLRELIREDTSRPEMSGTLARIASRGRVEVDSADVREMIDEGRE